MSSSARNYIKLLSCFVIKLFIFDFNFLSQSLLSSELDNLFNVPYFITRTYLHEVNDRFVSFRDFVNNRPILKSYGPLLLDINNVKYDDKLFFVPMLNSYDKPLFLAINCKTNLFNIKDINSWKGWFKPFFTYELNILREFCNK